MSRWYFWVLAPVMVAAAIIIPVAAAPVSLAGQIVVYVLSGTMLLATLGLADVARFHWALRSVAAVVLIAGIAYFVSELQEVLAGKSSALPGRRSSSSLWGAVLFLLAFGIPAWRFLMTGRSHSVVDEIAVDRGITRQRTPVVWSGPRPTFHDDVLGAIDWDDDEEGWMVPAQRSKAPFRVFVAGRDRPDERLMPHARELAADPGPLLDQVPAFLDAAAREDPMAAPEILGLRVESVLLLWPDAPDDGMVEFDGPNTEERFWRCDYADRRLRWLGFDD
jgi:hypothetical protein